MLGVDRLDMIKGIPQKILAFEKFLEENLSWRDKVVLLQIAVPTRTDVPECRFLFHLYPKLEWGSSVVVYLSSFLVAWHRRWTIYLPIMFPYFLPVRFMADHKIILFI